MCSVSRFLRRFYVYFQRKIHPIKNHVYFWTSHMIPSKKSAYCRSMPTANGRPGENDKKIFTSPFLYRFKIHCDGLAGSAIDCNQSLSKLVMCKHCRLPISSSRIRVVPCHFGFSFSISTVCEPVMMIGWPKFLVAIIMWTQIERILCGPFSLPWSLPSSRGLEVFTCFRPDRGL